jgi:YidC/Oxa1 family membrane protein insertase
MNAIAGVWPYNYGLAIMLMTIIIRIVFWPLTHKSTQSMKRMQAVQPLMKEIREKFKDNAQKQQQEMMKLYKEHKINPLGGCLPMLIQIPVFIALFVVLRSAIELRFAGFLWIRDLSEAENLFQFGFTVPLVGWSAFNILPILMAVTMAWQQKLTPSTGDAQQQKIMMIMPVMMLFFFYNFASGLSLYWTTNQVLMIVQLYWQRRHPTALAKA